MGQQSQVLELMHPARTNSAKRCSHRATLVFLQPGIGGMQGTTSYGGPCSKLGAPTLLELFGRTLKVDGTIYNFESVAAADRPNAPAESLTTSEHSTLEGYILVAIRAGHCKYTDGRLEWNKPFALANLRSRPEYAGIRHAGNFPTLTANCSYYDLVNNRPCQLETIWCVQGFPHPRVASLLALHPFCPFPQLVE